jgi:hypothetical protein
VRTSHSDAELRVAGADRIVNNCASITLDRSAGLDPLVLVLNDDGARRA